MTTLIEELARVHRGAERLVRRRIATKTDRPFQQLKALRAMRGEEIHTQAALAERLAIDAPAASRLIDRLVADKLVRRRQGADRRCVCLELTATGLAEIEVLDEAVAYVERELLSHITASEARAMRPLLRVIGDGLIKAP